jgi:alpha-glucosidase
MAGMYLTLRGTPIMYYGEELGMENNDPKRKEDVKDPLGISGWPENKGRDGERTPMQWASTKNAGFTDGKPWLPIPQSYTTHNVQSELTNPDSVLQFYKRLLALRRERHALLDGRYIPLNQNNPSVLTYIRSYKGYKTDEEILVVLNMSWSSQSIHLDQPSNGDIITKRTTLLTSFPTASTQKYSEELLMDPYSVYIARVVR